MSQVVKVLKEIKQLSETFKVVYFYSQFIYINHKDVDQIHHIYLQFMVYTNRNFYKVYMNLQHSKDRFLINFKVNLLQGIYKLISHLQVAPYWVAFQIINNIPSYNFTYNNSNFMVDNYYSFNDNMPDGLLQEMGMN